MEASLSLVWLSVTSSSSSESGHPFRIDLIFSFEGPTFPFLSLESLKRFMVDVIIVDCAVVVLGTGLFGMIVF